MRVLAITSIFLLGGALVVQAQGLAPYWSAVGPGSYHHASTAAEGAARGMADVIRSRGAANLMNSEAAINIEQARSANIDNHLKYTQTYFQMKTINKQYRDAQRRPPPTQQQAIRYNQARLPDRLTAQNINPLTGDIKWPFAFQINEFKDYKAQMQAIFEKRAEQGFLDPYQFAEVKDLAAGMESELKKHRNILGGNATIEARKFLESLVYEAQFQAG